MYFMLVKIHSHGGLSVVRDDCLVKPGLFEKLKVGHYRIADERGIEADDDTPNVVSCTHYNKKEE